MNAEINSRRGALCGEEAGVESLEEVEEGEGDGSEESCPMEGVGNEVVQSRGGGRSGGGRWRGVEAAKEV